MTKRHSTAESAKWEIREALPELENLTDEKVDRIFARTYRYVCDISRDGSTIANGAGFESVSAEEFWPVAWEIAVLDNA